MRTVRALMCVLVCACAAGAKDPSNRPPADAADCAAGPAAGCPCDLEGSTVSCGTETGECVSGQMKCSGGTWGDCRGHVPPSESEECNGLDDDCDGQNDEGCACGEGAILPCGSDEGACIAGTQRCEGGSWGECTGAVMPTDESCNAEDDDCDGATDEGCSCIDGNTMPCGLDVGACEAGMQICAGGVWGDCSGGVGPRTELCDGQDNDCNGTTDEGGNGCGGACPLPGGPGAACDGSDGDTCTDDTYSCTGSNAVACSSGATNPTCTTCPAMGGTICENGNGACNGIGPASYECGHCCGGSASPSCAALGGTRCGAGACANDGPTTYDCNRCCGGSIVTCGYLWPGQGLGIGEARTSCDGRFTLIMQGDSNLVLYWNGVGALWATATNPTGANFAIMQDDGNFVVYSPGGAVFHTGTNGNPGAFLAIQTDGNLVVYRSDGVPLWNSGTCCH